MSRRRAFALALTVVALLAGCGLTEDDEPQAIAPENLPPDLLDPNPGSSTTLAESPGTTTVDVYLLEDTPDGVRLVAVPREVAEPSIPDERLVALFGQGTEEEAEQGLYTNIPADTVLRNVDGDDEGDEVVVNLSREIFDIEGESLAQAFAQIVWTVTEPDAGGYRQVRFLVDGEATPVLDGDGAEQDDAVARTDYTTYAPR
jgi:spore germination protein GerM